MKQTFVPLVLQDLPKETIINAINWFEDLECIDESIADCTYLIFEVLCCVSTLLSPSCFENTIITVHIYSETRQAQTQPSRGQDLQAQSIFYFSVLDVLQMLARRKKGW
jgi:hypothetical protein